MAVAVVEGHFSRPAVLVQPQPLQQRVLLQEQESVWAWELVVEHRRLEVPSASASVLILLVSSAIH